MILIQIAEIVWDFYNRGRNNATAQTYSKEQIAMLVRQGLSSKMIRNYIQNKKLNDGDEYYATAALLSTQRFDIGKPDANGTRMVDMSNFDLYRLPKNAHIINAFPVGCSGTEGSAITVIQNGEEYFYRGAKFKGFRYAVVVGRKLKTFNLPP